MNTEPGKDKNIVAEELSEESLFGISVSVREDSGEKFIILKETQEMEEE